MRVEDSMAHPEESRLRVHPHLESVTEELEATVTFAGFIGETGREGKVRLYLTLFDLSQYLEIEERAIVRTVEAPQKGVFVWVKADSPVRAVRTQVRDARTVAANIALNQRRFAYPWYPWMGPRNWRAFPYGMWRRR
jgi:hypothetical protein